MSALSVRFPEAGPAAGVLSTLPLSYAAVGPDGSAAVTVVGGETGWPQRLASAARGGAAGVILVDPVPAVSTWDGAAVSPTVVVVDSTWAANPAVETAATHVRAALQRAGRLESRVVAPRGADGSRALLAQLMLLRSLAGPLTDLAVRFADRHGYLATGTVNGVTAELALTRTDALPEHATVRVLTGDGGVELRLPASDNAGPAHVHLIGPDGDRQLPTLYESAHRTTWRRLHRLLSAGASCSDLDDLLADIALVRAAGDHFS